MPPKNKPALIYVGDQRTPELTFNTTSLQPFLRSYTRMRSRDTGGGDRQFMEEFNLCGRIVEELNRWRGFPPDTIHELVTNITDPDGDERRWYPTMRSERVSEETARQNRIIITILLMQHATNDHTNGKDCGETSGGLWLPPRAQGRAAQEAAREQNRHPRYPTWSREEAVLSTPSVGANWTSSGVPLPSSAHRPQGPQGFATSGSLESPVGYLTPFSPTYAPNYSGAYSAPPSSGGTCGVYGPPSTGLVGYGLPPRGPQQHPSYSDFRNEHNTMNLPPSLQPQVSYPDIRSRYHAPPPPPDFQRRTSCQDLCNEYKMFHPPRDMHQLPSDSNIRSGYIIPSGEIRPVPYESPPRNGYEITDHPFWQTDNHTSSYGGRPAAHVPQPPGFEQEAPTAFGSEMSSPVGPLQPPIGSNRPQRDSRRHGGRGSGGGITLETPHRDRTTSARETPGGQTPGSRTSRRGASRLPSPDNGAGW